MNHRGILTASAGEAERRATGAVVGQFGPLGRPSALFMLIARAEALSSEKRSRGPRDTGRGMDRPDGSWNEIRIAIDNPQLVPTPLSR